MLTFEDGSQMQVYVKGGTISGKVLIFNKENILVAKGRYEEGLPHGPFWLISLFFELCP